MRCGENMAVMADQPCCIEITRKHGDLCVFNDAMNGRQKIWVDG
jgi:hypothetical protein